tara:strand:- start:434 stop:712 length:279 start_codon:yes stop_codon:yes gene_type:complete
MRLRNKKRVLAHLKKFGVIGQFSAIRYYGIFPKELSKICDSLNSEGFYVGLKNEEILGLELEYHYIDLDDLYKAYNHGDVYSGIKAIKSENF